jgi:amino acid permease
LVCHDLAFSVMEDYRGVNRRRWLRVVLSATLLSLLAWLIIGVCGTTNFSSLQLFA